MNRILTNSFYNYIIAMDRIHNLYITSQTNKAGNTNYNYNLYFSSYGINIAPDEDAYLNITSFQTLNTFYNINDLSNNFKIKITTSFDVSFTYNFTLDNGNYNIQEFQNAVNAICSAYINIEYDTKKNKWLYTSKQVINNTAYIMPTTNNYKYFGLTANVWNEVFYTGGLLSNQINLNNFGLIVIKVMGLVETNRTLDNLNKNISSGDIYALISRQDNAVNSLINWIDYNGTFKKKISNNEINYLNFIFMDEFNNLLLDINDWLLTMTITIRKKPHQLVPMLRE